MIYDTGSSDLWVTSKKCLDYQCQTHKVYDVDRSKTGEKIIKGNDRDTWFIEYGDGSVSGYSTKDSAWLGDMSIPDYVFGEAVDITDGDYENALYDGVCGLGFANLNSINGAGPIWEKFYNNGKIGNAGFGFYLTKTSNKEGSKLILGNYQKRYFEGELHWVKLVSKSYWQIHIDSVYLNGGVIGES